MSYPTTTTPKLQIADDLMICAMSAGSGPDALVDQAELKDMKCQVGIRIYSLKNDPENPEFLGYWDCGVPHSIGVHRFMYNGGRYVHLSAESERFEGMIYRIIDIADPKNPVEVGNWWSPEQFVDGLTKLMALRPEHISVYGLQIEEGTPFYERGIVCDQLLMRRMLEETHWRLEKAGYHHYEISNFALPGCRAQHNTHYWQNGEYVGLGAAAASYLNGRRSQNTANIAEYIQKINRGECAVVFEETLEGKAKLGESLMLGLRQLDGFTPSKSMWRAFGKEIDKHIQNGLLAQKNNTIKLTFEGLFLANEVFYSFVAPFEDA